MEFIKGADVSSLLEVERCGGTFRDGNAPEEAFSLLRQFGINGIRLRLWNDPYDEQGNDYGGGACDLPTVLTLARRAKNAGMRWMPAPHFSDFWVDPGRQTRPKAWRGLDDLSTRHQKDLVVVEAGTVFSQESYAAYERLPEDNRKGTSAKPEMVKDIEYPMTPAGQTAYIRDLISVFRAVPEGCGKGFFWWEAAWLPVPGSGWAKRPGWEYLEAEGPEGNEWANQTLFGYDGRTLPALSAIRDA